MLKPGEVRAAVQGQSMVGHPMSHLNTWGGGGGGGGGREGGGLYLLNEIYN